MREEIIGNARLILGDCREALSEIGPQSVIVSDPPYGIGYVRGTALTGLHKGPNANKHAGVPVFGDKEPFDPAPWIGMASEIILWGADHFYCRLPDSGRFLAWNKLGVLEPWDSFTDVEFAWHNQEGAARIFSLMWKGLIGSKQGENNGTRDHPTQKPIALMEWCLTQLKDKTSPVFDPFMGSGTTGVACAKMGRAFIGCEIEEKHHSTSCRRIEAAQRQGDLLRDIQPAPKLVTGDLWGG